MRVLFKRELQAYFYTPAAYVFMGVFLALGSVFFAVNNLAARSSDFLSLLWMLSYLWMLLTPVLTMRSFAGERSAHTEQMLFTSPVSLTGVVVGKFLAAVCVLLLTVALTGVYVLIVGLFGRVYLGEIVCGYLGFILQGCAFIALDMLVSARAKTVMTAAVWGLGANLLLWLADVLSAAVQGSWMGRVLDFVSLYKRFQPFELGQLSYAGLLYFLAFIVLMLFAAVRTIEARRWSER